MKHIEVNPQGSDLIADAAKVGGRDSVHQLFITYHFRLNKEQGWEKTNKAITDNATYDFRRYESDCEVSEAFYEFCLQIVTGEIRLQVLDSDKGEAA